MSGSLWSYEACDGSATCPSHVHIHGCLRYFGTCDRPREHDPAEKMRRLHDQLVSRGVGA